jgi:hypothetical protein
MGNDIVAECLKDKQLNRPEYLRFDSVINKESSRVYSRYLIHLYTIIGYTLLSISPCEGIADTVDTRAISSVMLNIQRHFTHLI